MDPVVPPGGVRLSRPERSDRRARSASCPAQDAPPPVSSQARRSAAWSVLMSRAASPETPMVHYEEPEATVVRK